MEFKTFGKKAVSVGLSCALLASTSLTAFAAGTSDVTLQVKGNSDTEPPEIVNIRIPAEIPLTMDEEGAITVEDGLYIENLSDTTGVTVSGISVTGKNGWNIVDFDTDLSGEAENTQKLSMSFNGDGTEDGGAVTLTPDAWDIAKSEQLALTVGAKMPKQNEDSYATKASIATVNYSFSANSTTEPGGGAGEDPTPDEGQITNNWDSQRALLSTGAREVTFSWESTDESASITEVRSEDEGVATVQKASTFSLTSMDYSGSENWTVTAVGKGKTTVTATLSSGETTQFEVEVYELTSGGSDVTVDDSNVTGGDTLEPGTDLGDGNHDITIDIPITTPDGEDTITVTPEFPEDTVLEEGENNITVDVVVDGVTLHITITINIKGSNPSDGLVQSVQEAQAMGFTFSSYGDGLQIDSFENKQFKSEVNVPEQIGDFKVLKIGDSVFKGQTNLKKITLPDSVTAIGISSFNGCTGLTTTDNIITPYVTSIGSQAFQDCTGLDTVTLPKNVTFIGASAFKGAGSQNGAILNIECNVPDGTSSTSVFGGAAFNELNVGKDTTALGNYSFYNCSKFEYIKLPSNIANLGNSTFAGCTKLTIEVPKTVSSIGTSCFKSVKKIYYSGSLSVSGAVSRVYLSEPVFTEDYAYEVNNDGSVTIGEWLSTEDSVVIPSEVEGKSVTKIANRTFAGDSNIVSVDIPDSVTSIGIAAFSSCSTLQSVKLPANLETLSTSLFKACASLKDVTLPTNLVEVGENAFDGCTSLLEVSLPESVEAIDTLAFYNCSGLEMLVVPKSVKYLGGNAFLNSGSSVGEVHWGIPKLTTDMTAGGSISSYALANTGFGTVIVEDGVTELPESFLQKAVSVTKIVLPDTLTKVGDFAFSNLDAATEIELPESVNYIGTSAMINCDKLETVVLPKNANYIGSYAFEDCKQLTSVVVPNGVNELKMSTFKGCTSLRSVTLPSSITTIGDYCFYGCTDLSRLDIPSSVSSIGDRAFKDVKHIYYTGTASGSPWGALAIN